MEVVEAVLGAKKSKNLNFFGRVRGWSRSVFKVIWWSFSEIFVILNVLSFGKAIAGVGGMVSTRSRLTRTSYHRQVGL